MSRDILSVDAEAGVRLVSEKQIAGPWHVPAELVRLALAHGASKVEVEIRSSRLVVAAYGARIGIDDLELLVEALSPTDEVQQLKALQGLEDRDCTALLWAARLSERGFRVESPGPGGSGVVVHGSRGSVRLNPTGSVSVLRVEVKRPAYEWRRAERWLRTACRFSPRPVLLGSEDVRQTLRSGCFRADVKRPLPMVVALGVDLESPKLWLLRHGVVQSRVSVPGWPAFEAAVEMAAEVRGWASAHDLRAKLSAHLPALIDRVVELMIRVVPRLQTVGESHGQRIRLALLRALKKDVLRNQILDAKLFELAENGRQRWVSIAGLNSMSADGPLAVAERCGVSGGIGPVLLAGPAEQSALQDHLEVDLYRLELGYEGRWSRFKGSLPSALWRLASLVRSPLIGSSELSAEEGRLAKRLGKNLQIDGRPAAVVFSRSGRKVRRDGAQLVLPRKARLVRACLKVMAKDRDWIYPVALALTAGQEEVDADVRSSWIASGSADLTESD